MRALVVIAVLAAPAAALAGPIAVEVVDTAGAVAYVTPGRDAGVVAGVKIRFGARTLTVIDATAGTAAVALDGPPLAIGATGVADVTPGAAAVLGARLPAPRPLDGWRAQWPAAARPAEQQHPAPVPLGGGDAGGPLRATLTLHGAGVIGLDRDEPARSAAASLRAAVSYQLLRARPLAIDVDASARGFLDGRAGPRTPLWLHQAQLRYGAAAAPRLAVGRLAWAAASVGMLDGVRAMARFGAVELAGFGGVVPDPIDGRPDAGATRFGAEAIYDAPAAPWQPRLALTLVGSTWDGAIDERRATVAAEVARGAFTVSGWAEGQAFDADNPWRAGAIELTGAGAALDWQRRGQRASVDVGFARPERSRRLAAALPPAWLCWPTPGAPGADPDAEPCAGGDHQLTASASAGLDRGRLRLDASVHASRTATAGVADELAGTLLAEWRLGPGLRLVGGGAGGRAAFLDWYAVEGGVALDRGRRWDLSVRYRPELVAYAGALDRFLTHTVVADGRLRLARRLDAALAASATTGEDRRAVAAFATLVWRAAP